MLQILCWFEFTFDGAAAATINDKWNIVPIFEAPAKTIAVNVGTIFPYLAVAATAEEKVGSIKNKIFTSVQSHVLVVTDDVLILNDAFFININERANEYSQLL